MRAHASCPPTHTFAATTGGGGRAGGGRRAARRAARPAPAGFPARVAPPPRWPSCPPLRPRVCARGWGRLPVAWPAPTAAPTWGPAGGRGVLRAGGEMWGEGRPRGAAPRACAGVAERRGHPSPPHRPRPRRARARLGVRRHGDGPKPRPGTGSERQRSKRRAERSGLGR